MYSFNLFFTKSLRKNFTNGNLDFCGSYSQFFLGNWVFQTYTENIADKTLHFEDLAVTKYLFLKDVCIC